MVSVRVPANDADPTGAIEEALHRRGREAYDLIAGLKDTLAGTLERLSGLVPLAHADPSSLRGYYAGGLPVLNLDGVRGEVSVDRPWWSGLAPSLAMRATERSIPEQAGLAITETVEFYDRQLESWLKTMLARLTELYEAQAAAFREQVRRLATGQADVGMDSDAAALEADLRELRGTPEDARVASRS